MDRSTVLDLIGSPTTVKRERQPHIWYYKFVHNDIYEVQEVHFTGDYVSYVGEPKKRDPLPVETVELSDVEKDIYFSKKKEPSPSYEESVEQTTKGSPEQRVIPDFKEIK